MRRYQYFFKFFNIFLFSLILPLLITTVRADDACTPQITPEVPNPTVCICGESTGCPTGYVCVEGMGGSTNCWPASDYKDVCDCDECAAAGNCGATSGGCEDGYICTDDLKCRLADPGECDDSGCKHPSVCGKAAEACPINHVCKSDGTCELDTIGYYCVGVGECDDIGACGEGSGGNEGKYCKVSEVSPYKTMWIVSPCLYDKFDNIGSAQYSSLEDCEKNCTLGPCCGMLGETECIHNKCGVAANCQPGEKCMEFGGHWSCGYHEDCSGGERPKNLVYNGPIIDSLDKILSPVTKILYYGGLFIGICFVIFSGYRLMVSQGNPRETQDAQEQLTAAILGILFILLSAAILRIIINNIFTGFTSI